MRTPDELLADLAHVVRTAFPDRDFPDVVDTSMRVFADLGMASIEIVVLAEKLDAYFGMRLPFGTFLKGLRERGADDIALGELVTFLQQHVS
ncbi:MAG: acyl carrier protein [Planctomycetes bacterium]|nr:acyl carrier protein [Planctomycetota bacterium]